jgi:hypothetical protein
MRREARLKPADVNDAWGIAYHRLKAVAPTGRLKPVCRFGVYLPIWR